MNKAAQTAFETGQRLPTPKFDYHGGDLIENKIGHVLDTLPSGAAMGIAVSGGSDSLALLQAVHECAQTRALDPTALTVDHGLRSEAADEAAYVAAICKRMGISHTTLTWNGVASQRGLLKQAREARYRLLADFCFVHGIRHIFLGHTMDDQAETVLMRLQRTKGAGGQRGSSGMAERFIIEERSGVALLGLRPLLPFSRAQLKDYLQCRGIEWLNDPTNKDDRFERTRVRQHLSTVPAMREKLVSFADVSGCYRAALSHDAAYLIERYGDYDCGGRFVLNCTLSEEPEPVAVLVLQTLLSVVGGLSFLPSYDKVQSALRRCTQTSLARSIVSFENDGLTIAREVRGLPQPIGMSEPKIICWDNRFLISQSQASSRAKPLDDGIIVAGASIENATDDDGQAIIKTAPYRVGTFGGQESVQPIVGRCARQDYEVKVKLGAFERFCPSFDWRLRDVLSMKTSLPVHDD